MGLLGWALNQRRKATKSRCSWPGCQVVPLILCNKSWPAGSYKLIGETYLDRFVRGTMKELVGKRGRDIAVI